MNFVKQSLTNVDTKIKVMLKFGSLETLSTDRSKKQFNLPHCRYMSNLGLCTCFHAIKVVLLCLYTKKVLIIM